MGSEAVEATEEMLDFKERIKKESESLVLTQFPRKILSLDKLLNSPRFQLSNVKLCPADPNIPIPEEIQNGDDTHHPNGKKRKLDGDAGKPNMVYGFVNGMSKCNPTIVEIVDIVKPKVLELVEDANKIKMWILFLIPRIEDGNNFGVSIQEDILSEIRAVEADAAAYFDLMSKYFLTRGKVVSRIAKFPHIEDYRRSLAEVDENQFLNIRLTICEVRNHYAGLHDLIDKNLDKIKKPRNSNTENMY